MKYFAISLIIIFVIFAISHLIFAYLRLIRKKNGYSYVPLINGLIGSVALVLYPNNGFSEYWWLPFVVDWGCLPLLVETIVFRFIVRRRRS